MEEIRKIRQQHASMFNYDLDAIFRDLKEKQEESGRKVVSLAAKRPKEISVAQG